MAHRARVVHWTLGLGLGLCGCAGSEEGGSSASPELSASTTGSSSAQPSPGAPASGTLAPTDGVAPTGSSPPAGAAPVTEPNEPSEPAMSPTPEPAAGGSPGDAGGAAGGNGAVAGANGAVVAGSGGTDDGGSSAPAVNLVGDDFVEEVEVAVHPEVNTLLEVTWTQSTAADEVWLEFEFEEGNTMSSRPASGDSG